MSAFIGDEFPAEYECPVAVGDEIEVTGTLCVTNSQGGTEILRHTGVRCVVTKTFWDYETGWGMHGQVIDPDDIEMIRQQAQTPYTPEWYQQNRPDDVEGYRKSSEAQATFSPSRVYFSERDIPRSTPVPSP